jgi:uncharacterized protein YndB with AHSA1/START domain
MSSADVAVSVHVDAPAETVYDLVADLPRMGEWSPECTSVTWRHGATAAAPGARFRGWNRRGPIRWWTDATVVEAERGRALSFEVRGLGQPVALWAYRFEPDPSGQGCTVTEEWTDRRSALYRIPTGLIINVRDRPSHNRAGMERTLAQLKAAAERGGR